MSRRQIAISAAIVSAITVISRVLGYIRDAVFVALFGVSGWTDAYIIAFRIPNMLRDLMAEGALSSSFIPVFNDYKEKRSQKDLWRLANNVLTVLTLILMLIVILGIIFAPALVALQAPGFMKDPEKFNLTIELTRILLPFIMMVSIASILMGILNSFKHFSVPAFAPVAFNIGIILVGVIVVPRLNPHLQIYGWAAGSLFGAFLQILIQAIAIRRLGFRIRPIVDLKEKGLRRVGKLMIPATIGQSITQLNILINSVIGSFLTAGSITYLYCGNRLMQFPLGVFGVAIATVSFPFIAQYVSRNDMTNLKSTIRNSLKQAYFIVIPATVGIIVLSRQINMMLFYYGKFTYSDVINTANASIMYSIGIFAFTSNKILTQVYYAMDNAKKAVKIGAVSVAANIVFNISLALPFGFMGLALGTTLSGILNFSMLYFFLHKKLGDIGIKEIIRYSAKILGASLVMGIAAYCTAALLEVYIPGTDQSRMKNGLVVIGAIGVGAFSYVGAVWMMKIEEGRKFFELLMKKLKSRGKQK